MKLRALLLLFASAFLSCVLNAQESTEASRGPDGGTRSRVSGIVVLPVAGKPFSGRDIIEWTRNLEDGGVVTVHLSAVVARDSQGHIYRERRNFVSDDTNQPSKLIDKIFLDPIAHTRTTCTMAARRCSITGYYSSASFAPAPTGSLDNGTRHLTRESLGDSVMADLNVVGTRETLSVNAGTIGNNRPLVTTREFWYSPDLEINLSVTRKDPREGTQVIHLVDLSRSEPDPALFQVPADFAIHDLRGSAESEN